MEVGGEYVDSPTRTLKTFLTFCVDSGWIAVSPAKKVKAGLSRQPPTEPFTDEEVIAILDACERLKTKGTYGTVANRKRVRAFMLILRYTGLRISDAASLDTTRDTFAVSLLESGTTIQDVAILLGHESTATTEKSCNAWVKSRPERLEAAVQKTWQVEKPKLRMIQGGA
ncbi:MAG: phage integrase family protein [Acidobacteria bacterium]|nr:phage integrase family protein [Acidobacteriota bacterium]